MNLIVGSREGHIGSCVARYVELFSAEQLLPLGIGANDFLHARPFQPIARVVEFAKAQLKNDQTDPIYFGLFRRTDPSVDQILWDLLKDPDATVRIGALRVVGLLRRADILDRFVKESTSAQDQRTRDALATARALVVRD